jgi:hypothetical protein
LAHASAASILGCAITIGDGIRRIRYPMAFSMTVLFVV